MAFLVWHERAIQQRRRCCFHENHAKTLSVSVRASRRTEVGPRQVSIVHLGSYRDCCVCDSRTRELLLEAAERRIASSGLPQDEVDKLVKDLNWRVLSEARRSGRVSSQEETSQ